MTGGRQNEPITIFRAGRHTAMSGASLDFSAADLEATVSGYDPALHEAPLVIGHPRDNAPAYGWIGSLTLAGRELLATPRQVNPEFAEAVNAGRFKKVSASFYRPDAPHNPLPGVYYLRHVGFLGAQPPAVKGLGDARFADGEDGVVTIEFGEPGIALDFARFVRRLREFVIDKFSLADADRVVPEYMAEQLEITGVRKIAETTQFSETAAFAQTSLSRRLRSLMNANDVTTEQLAKASGIAASTMASILSGEIERPPDRRLRGFARSLGVSFDSLRRLVTESEDLSEQGEKMHFADTDLVRYLLQRMTQLQVTTADLAEGDGLDSAAVDGILSGRVTVPNHAQLGGLACILGTTAETLKAKAGGSTEFAERESDIARREAVVTEREQAIAQRERKTERQETVAFVEEQIDAGRLLPRHREELTAVLESLQPLDEVAFGEGDSEQTVTPVDWLKRFVESLPEQIDYQERAAPETDTSNREAVPIAVGYTAEADRVALHRKALAYQEANDVDYVTAVQRVGG